MFSEEVKKVCNHFKDKNKLGLRHHKFYNQIKSETNFLSEEAIIGQRFWHVLHNTKDIPKCLKCKIKEVKWFRSYNEYSIFCSQKCSNNNINVRKQISNNNKKSWQNKSKEEKEGIQKKRKQTNLEKYGVDNPMRSKRFQDKFSKSYQNKSEKEKEEINKKRKQTNLNKYGVDNPTKSKKISKQISLKNKINWQNKSEEEKEGIIRKHKQTILNRYGVEYVSQRHLSKDTLKKLNDPKYLRKQHYNKKKTLKEIAKELGMYGTSSINKNFHKYNIPILTHPSSIGEKEVISYIKDIYKKDFPTNTRKVITPLELDIYLEDLKLAVEFNGTYWHSDFKKDKDYHFNKMKLCYDKNIKLINIYEYEWKSNKEEIKYWLNKYITNNLKDIITKDIITKDIITKDVYLKDIADKKEIILSLNWPINYELLKQNNFKFKEILEPESVKINNFDIYDAGGIVLERRNDI